MEERPSSQSPPDETHSLQQVGTRLLWLHWLLVISGATLERWITGICLFCQPLAGELRHFIPSVARSLSCRAPCLEIWGCLSAAETAYLCPSSEGGFSIESQRGTGRLKEGSFFIFLLNNTRFGEVRPGLQAWTCFQLRYMLTLYRVRNHIWPLGNSLYAIFW